MTGTAIIGLLALGSLAACDTPPLRIQYQVSNDGVGLCGATACADVPLLCDAYVSIRIVRPEDPSLAFVSECTRLPVGGSPDLCAISRADLPADVVLPNDTLWVQILVWPASAVTISNGEAVCPPGANVRFDPVRGFPTVGLVPSPAVGGSTYVGPDDEVAVVELGCLDLELINGPACMGAIDIDARATAIDFDTRVSVSGGTANRYNVSVGSPRVSDVNEPRWALFASETSQLRLVDDTAATPAWAGVLANAPQDYVCIEVREDLAPRPGVACELVPPELPATLTLRGVRVPDETADRVVIALGLPAAPARGMTLGIVVDFRGFPVEGAVVNPELTPQQAEDIQYLNADLTGVVPGATSASGLFVSLGATLTDRFVFDVTNPADSSSRATAIGGAIEGKTSVVILQLPQSIDAGP